MARSDGVVILYTPVYYTSPGTRYRVKLIAKSLTIYGYKPVVITLDSSDNGSSNSTMSRSLYYRIGDRLLQSKAVYNTLGVIQYRRLMPAIKHYKERIRGIILFTDVAAPLSMLLRKMVNAKIIASIEDISTHYIQDIKSLDNIRSHARRNLDNKKSQLRDNFINQLCETLRKWTDHVITPARTLSDRINKDCSIKSITVPIGIDMYIDEFDLINSIMKRSTDHYSVLLAGQLFTPTELYKAAMLLFMLHTLHSRMYFYIFAKGRYNSLLGKIIKNSHLYYYKDIDTSIRENIKKHIGLVVTTRRAYTLSRIYYHAMLAQPIILYDSYGQVRREAEYLKVAAIDVTKCIDSRDLACLEEKLDNIVENYYRLVKIQYENARRLLIPHVHRDLLKLLS